MVSKRADSRERKDLILGIVVEEYIKTINPVSSANIVEQFPLDLSSATIRNILAELEEEGYLTHPHTSAGRIPTQSGYRYYVDKLMHQIQLLEEEKDRIKAEYRKDVNELENLIEKTSAVISDITEYTSIVSVDGWSDKFFLRGIDRIVQYPDSRDVKRIGNILHALEEKEKILHIINRDLVNKVQIYIGHELAFSEMDDCSMVISGYQTSKGASGRIAVLGPTRMNYRKVVSALNYFSQLIREVR